MKSADPQAAQGISDPRYQPPPGWFFPTTWSVLGTGILIAIVALIGGRSIGLSWEIDGLLFAIGTALATGALMLRYVLDDRPTPKGDEEGGRNETDFLQDK